MPGSWSKLYSNNSQRRTYTPANMPSIPLNHFRHLKRLADLRRTSVDAAVQFLLENVEASDENWLDGRWPGVSGEREVPCGSTPPDQLIRKIQGLPRNIRPVTDGQYLKDFDFFQEGQGLLGIEAEGVKLLDFEMATYRDREVFGLVKDLLPDMTVEQYRIYNTFCSQYLRLVREPNLFTMPNSRNPAIDAGCYVGYKAIALAQFVRGQPVLAFELAPENYEVLKRNVKNNPDLQVETFRAALSDKREKLVIHTRNERTMAHSLTNFEGLKEADTSLLNAGDANMVGDEVETILLDDVTMKYDRLSAVHISVNGHEPEVVKGAKETARKADILRVSCPYSRDGKPIFDLVVEQFNDFGVKVFGKSGAAVIAGRKQGNYHAV